LVTPKVKSRSGTAGTVSEFPAPTRHIITVGITRGPDGHLWFTERDVNGRGGKIGRLSCACATTSLVSTSSIQEIGA